jgi:hypothetical protein
MDHGKKLSNVDALKHPGEQRLSDPKIVRAVLADMLRVVAEAPQNSVTAIKAATRILTGEDTAYSPAGSWKENDSGAWIRGHMNGVPETGAAKAAVEYALAHLALHSIEATRAVTEGTATVEQAGRRMRGLLENWTRLMLGVLP